MKNTMRQRKIAYYARLQHVWPETLGYGLPAYHAKHPSNWRVFKTWPWPLMNYPHN